MLKKLVISFLLLFVIIIGNSFAQPKGDFQGERPKMDPDEMSQKISGNLKKELNLTDDQYKSVYDIYKNHFIEMNNIMDKYGEKDDDVQEIVKKKRAELKLGMSGILSDDQMDKWEDLEKENQQKMGPPPGDRQRPPGK